MVKLINFIRCEGKAVGRWPPDLSSKDVFQSERWLKPQLEDDALLYSLHDVIGENLDDEMNGVTLRVNQIQVAQPPQRDYHLSRDPRPDNPIYRIAEMEQQVKMAQRGLEQFKQLLAEDMQLHSQLNNNLTLEGDLLEIRSNHQETDVLETGVAPNSDTSKVHEDVESSYFASYSGHGKVYLRCCEMAKC